jgi:peptidoglycan hydrolase-like protein with peptidoglycan-binding domain
VSRAGLRRRPPVSAEVASDGAGPPPRRRRLVPLALGLATLVVAGIAAATLLGSGHGQGRRSGLGGGSSVPVTRQNLVDRQTVDGTLGFAGSRTVINRLAASGGSSPDGKAASSPGGPRIVPAVLFTPPDRHTPARKRPKPEKPKPEKPKPEKPKPKKPAPSTPADDSYHGSGTVTGLARPGSVVRRGGRLYSLDGDPIVLMYGSLPAYRSFRTGMTDGRDVLELEENLAALGFDPGTVDEAFTVSTAAAVKAWQASVGLRRSGSLALGRIVFLPGPRRIGQLKTSPGSVLGAGAQVLDTSSTKRVVSVELDASLQSLAHRGEAVTVTMPSGATVRGRISKVGRVAREKSDSQGADNPGGGGGTLVIDVTVELRSDRGVGRLDEAPVSVGLAKESRRHVLAVPVNALVARRGGGYGVELAATRHIVPVDTGLFAGGYVEVSGAAIREGTRVVVPSA